MAKKTEYNVCFIDNGNGTYSIGHIMRLKHTPAMRRKHIFGEWVEGCRDKIVRLLKEGTLK